MIIFILSILGVDEADSITDNMCAQAKNVFNDVNDFANKGGMKVDILCYN